MRITAVLLAISTLFSFELAADIGANDGMNSNTNLPPEMMAYLAGASSTKYLEFDFLIGDWSVEGIQPLPDGSKIEYAAQWKAHYINDKRMIIDDFQALSPNGKALSSYVTLRSYSPVSERWELSGLAAMTPGAPTLEWFGNMKGEEMVLMAKGPSPTGDVVLTRIRFFEIAQEQFKWDSSLSFDEGQSWVDNGSLVARRTTSTD